MKKYRKYLISALTAALCSMLFVSCDEEDPKSEACDILLFSVDSKTWTINGTNITRTYPSETVEGPLTPTINLSPGATVNPPASEAQNFFTEQGVTYTVTAENGKTTKTYVAKATRTPSSECVILKFVVNNEEWDIVNDSLITHVYASAPPEGLLTPTITLPPGATVNPPSNEAQNFFIETGVTYTVTSEDGQTTKTYIVKARKLSSECDILSFGANGVNWTIDNDKLLITGTYSLATTQSLTPTIVVSQGATVTPSSGVPQNLFNETGVKYTVTSEDGKAKKTYTAKAIVLIGGEIGDCMWSVSSAHDTLVIYGNGDMPKYEGDVTIARPWSQYYSKITTIIIADGVTGVSDNAFRDRSVLNEYGDNEIYPNLTSVTIGNSVTVIGYAAFAYCRNLTSVTLGNSLQILDQFAFHECISLASIDIPNSVTTIEMSAFNHGHSLVSVKIGNSVSHIGEYAFNDCVALTTITIPRSVTLIDGSVFANCGSLTEVINLNPTPQNIEGANIFNGINPLSQITLRVPAGSVQAYRAAPGWSELENIVGI
jgi:uncharacterized lipoprotein YajG